MNPRLQLLLLAMIIVGFHACQKRIEADQPIQAVNGEELAAPPGGNYWQSATFFNGVRSGACTFVINGKGYVFGGYQSGAYKKDLWEYNPSGATWTQKASLPLLENGRMNCAAFVINNKGYVVGGDQSYNAAEGYQTKDVWEYDPVNNTWTARASIPTGRGRATSFAINGKGYVAFGSNDLTDLFMDDVIEFDPVNNTWIAKSALLSGSATDLGRYQPVSFVVNNKAYIGTGFGPGQPQWCLKDFWEYDPAANSWTQKADFGGGFRAAAVAFGSGGAGYVGTGYNNNGGQQNLMNDFWVYSPGANTWTQRPNFPGYGRYSAIGFYAGGKGYMGLGYRPNYYTNDFYKYNPPTSIISPSMN